MQAKAKRRTGGTPKGSAVRGYHRKKSAQKTDAGDSEGGGEDNWAAALAAAEDRVLAWKDSRWLNANFRFDPFQKGAPPAPTFSPRDPPRVCNQLGNGGQQCFSRNNHVGSRHLVRACQLGFKPLTFGLRVLQSFQGQPTTGETRSCPLAVVPSRLLSAHPCPREAHLGLCSLQSAPSLGTVSCGTGSCLETPASTSLQILQLYPPRKPFSLACTGQHTQPV